MTGKRMNLLARPALICCLLIAAFAATPNASAVDYPVRPIKLVVPYAAGGPTDVLGRLVADYLGRDLKQTVIVENKPGAQGAIGAEADLPVVMEVHPSVPAKTVAEFVAYAKQNPGKLNFGSAGTGGTIHLAGEMFKQMAGIEMTHVPYKGAGPALTDLLSGNIQVMFDSMSTALPPIKAGLLRPLGVSSTQRSPDLPDVPTIAESGYPDYAVSVWYGIVAPSKLPDEIAQKIRASLDRALNDDTFRASLEKIGFPVFRPRSAAAITEFIDADRARWSAVIRAQNISLD